MKARAPSDKRGSSFHENYQQRELTIMTPEQVQQIRAEQVYGSAHERFDRDSGADYLVRLAASGRSELVERARQAAETVFSGEAINIGGAETSFSMAKAVGAAATELYGLEQVRVFDGAAAVSSVESAEFVGRTIKNSRGLLLALIGQPENANSVQAERFERLSDEIANAAEHNPNLYVAFVGADAAERKVGELALETSFAA